MPPIHRTKIRSSSALLVVALPAVWLTAGCASIWTRGIVQDEQGGLVATASVRVVSVAGSNPVAMASTDMFGCFLVSHFAPRGERRFRLEVTAPGYELATFDLDLQAPVPILVATLARSAFGSQSAIHPATDSERKDRWEAFCDPLLPPGSQTLAP